MNKLRVWNVEFDNGSTTIAEGYSANEVLQRLRSQAGAYEPCPVKATLTDEQLEEIERERVIEEEERRRQQRIQTWIFLLVVAVFVLLLFLLAGPTTDPMYR